MYYYDVKGYTQEKMLINSNSSLTSLHKSKVKR